VKLQDGSFTEYEMRPDRIEGVPQDSVLVEQADESGGQVVTQHAVVDGIAQGFEDKYLCEHCVAAQYVLHLALDQEGEPDGGHERLCLVHTEIARAYDAEERICEDVKVMLRALSSRSVRNRVKSVLERMCDAADFTHRAERSDFITECGIPVEHVPAGNISEGTPTCAKCRAAPEAREK
jgi:hypothetical protein